MSTTLGTSADLQLVIPSPGATDWATSIRDNCFQKIVDHDHTGVSGKGLKLTATSAITADTIDDTLIKLRNNQCLRATDNAGTGTVNMMKVTTSDKVEICSDLSKVNMINDTYVTARNNADSADINMIKVSTADKVVVGSTNVTAVQGDAAGVAISNAGDITGIPAGISIDNVNDVTFSSSFAGADNQSSAANVTGIVCATDEFAVVYYKITRGTSVQCGKLMIDEDNTSVIEECFGDDTGVTFSNSSGQLQYTSTSTGNAPTIKFLMIKG